MKEYMNISVGNSVGELRCPKLLQTYINYGLIFSGLLKKYQNDYVPCWIVLI